MADVRRYSPGQERDPDGKWGDGVPGPSTDFFDMAGFNDVVEIEGTFGDLAMGVDDLGDVRIAFREGGKARELDVGADDITALGESLETLADARDELPEDADPRSIYDDDEFGADGAYRAELYGSGVIAVTFGHGEDDPYVLWLDPPDEEADEDDVAGLLAAIAEILTASGEVRSVEQRKYNPSQKREPDGKWGDGLGLVGRIDLAAGESLVASDRLDPAEASGSDSFADVMFAVVDGPSGRTARIGIIPHEDAGQWKAANRGATAELDADGVEQLRIELAAATAKAKKDAAAADRIWADGGNGNDYDDHVVDGVIASPWGDITYTVSLTDDEPISWLTTLHVGDAPDGTHLDAKDAAKLLRKLADLQAHLDQSSSLRNSEAEAMVPTRSFQPEDHPRAPTGTDNGGQFAKDTGGQKKTTPKRAPKRRPTGAGDGTLAYDAGSGQGTGYDSTDGDPRVHDLQQALNRLGVTDSAGKALKDDGKLGPKTTAAVKKLQARLGLKADGKVTPALLKQIKSLKSLPVKRSAFMDFCVRSFGFEFETRGRADSDGRTLEGYAAVFNSPTRIAAVGGDFDEVISPGAFTRSIRNRMPVLQFEHGRDPRIGAAPIGAIEDLSEDSTGLHVRAKLFDHPDIERVRQGIAARAITGMSFRFQVVDGGDRWERRSGGVDLRTVGDADVHELGPVVFPAYDTTTVSVRSLLAQLGPEEHRTLLRELAYDLRSIEPADVGPTARSSGDVDAERTAAGEQQHLSIRQRLDTDALRTRGITK